MVARVSNQKWAWYNEHDEFAANWLRELMKDGLIAEGEVDQRSIEDVTPHDIRSFRQCHFFAGIGIWSIAARLAGFDDDAPLWTGSCPCQPFSPAGKGEGFADERHLWPAFHYLIEQCGPALIAGEQVTGADGDAWFDLVSADLDATAYAFGVAETCAAGFGAPHERSRNYWLAHSLRARLEGHPGDGDRGHQPGRIGSGAVGSAAAGLIPDGVGHAADEGGSAIVGVRGGAGTEFARGSGTDQLADAAGARWREGPPRDDRADGGPAAQSGRSRDAVGLADVVGNRRGAWRDNYARYVGYVPDTGHNSGLSRLDRPGPVNGLWRDADWLHCRDERWRPVESGTFPLVDAGTFRNRVGLLRGAGNAVNLAQATGFLIAVRQALKL